MVIRATLVLCRKFSLLWLTPIGEGYGNLTERVYLLTPWHILNPFHDNMKYDHALLMFSTENSSKIYSTFLNDPKILPSYYHDRYYLNFIELRSSEQLIWEKRVVSTIQKIKGFTALDNKSHNCFQMTCSSLRIFEQVFGHNPISVKAI